jgi:N-acyl-D-aspartate/D-glutamate deacylase
MQATIGKGLFLEEFAAIQRRIGRPITWTALLADFFGPDGHRPILADTERLQRDGVRVVPQVSCRPLMFEFQWKAPFPFESMKLFRPVSAADAEGKKRIYADPAFRAAFRERALRGGVADRWDVTVISDAPDTALVERTVAAVAADRGVHPIDVALDVALASNLEARFRMAIMNMDETVVAELLRHPGTVLGLSDAGAHASQLCDACFSTHLLGHWVRERGVLGLEQAVAMLTSRPAELLGLRNRGRLAAGLAADVAIFDPATVGCSPLRRVRDLPAGADRLVSDASGIRAVIVNGVVIREDGADTIGPDAALPGHVLRGGRDAEGRF